MSHSGVSRRGFLEKAGIAGSVPLIGAMMAAVMDMAGHTKPVLTASQIAEQCNTPIGTKSLRELAEGKKTVAIRFDDLTRTTPAFTVTPWLMAELAKAGIKDEDVLLRN